MGRLKPQQNSKSRRQLSKRSAKAGCVFVSVGAVDRDAEGPLEVAGVSSSSSSISMGAALNSGTGGKTRVFGTSKLGEGIGSSSSSGRNNGV